MTINQKGQAMTMTIIVIVLLILITAGVYVSYRASNQPAVVPTPQDTAPPPATGPTGQTIIQGSTDSSYTPNASGTVEVQTQL
jgi:flagellar basal body-associated protein FliL